MKNYVKFRNIGKFPPNGYIQHEYIISNDVKNKDKNKDNDEYDKHMHYIREHQTLNFIRNRNRNRNIFIR